jgi:hypothetical protein
LLFLKIIDVGVSASIYSFRYLKTEITFALLTIIGKNIPIIYNAKLFTAQLVNKQLNEDQKLEKTG